MQPTSSGFPFDPSTSPGAQLQPPGGDAAMRDSCKAGLLLSASPQMEIQDFAPAWDFTSGGCKVLFVIRNKGYSFGRDVWALFGEHRVRADQVVDSVYRVTTPPCPSFLGQTRGGNFGGTVEVYLTDGKFRTSSVRFRYIGISDPPESFHVGEVIGIGDKKLNLEKAFSSVTLRDMGINTSDIDGPEPLPDEVFSSAAERIQQQFRAWLFSRHAAKKTHDTKPVHPNGQKSGGKLEVKEMLSGTQSEDVDETIGLERAFSSITLHDMGINTSDIEGPSPVPDEVFTNAAERIQKQFRAYLFRRHTAAKKLQRFMRGMMARKSLKRSHNAATIIQSHFRTNRVRREYQKLKHAAIMVQNNFRAKKRNRKRSPQARGNKLELQPSNLLPPAKSTSSRALEEKRAIDKVNEALAMNFVERGVGGSDAPAKPEVKENPTSVSRTTCWSIIADENDAPKTKPETTHAAPLNTDWLEEFSSNGFEETMDAEFGAKNSPTERPETLAPPLLFGGELFSTNI